MRKRLSPAIAVTLLFSCGAIAAACVLAADAPPGADAGGDSHKKLELGLSPTIRLLQLMDTDKNGKVSKQEFLHFMEAEFDFADKNHDGELDPRELRNLVQGLRHPIKGPGK